MTKKILLLRPFGASLQFSHFKKGLKRIKKGMGSCACKIG